MTILEEIYQKTKNIEENFKHKRVLFIGSESYDATTICVIEGLHKIGFEILVYKKLNINSWFCNTIINDLNNIENNIDFIISNLHWGTQWSLYNNFKHKVPYILIDGDDRLHGDDISDWKNKYNKNCKSYKLNPPEEIKDMILSPYRWMDYLGNYKPDRVFMNSKYKINTNNIYIPCGINLTYFKFFKYKNIFKKNYDICSFPGPGSYRAELENILNNYKKTSKYNIWNSKIYGEMQVDDKIKIFCEKDNNIHSWHRWRCCSDYFEKIMSSKIQIISPIDKYNAPGGIGIKRVTEAIAGGNYILYHVQPDVDDSSYPIEEISPYSKFKFNDYNEMVQKCEYLLENPDFLEEKRDECYKNAMKYFTSEPIARYFLWNIIN
tara:strand:+ start:1517 stop:2653 length:1137 start_codon:yes stop_codon:yes gene_type:complete